MPVHDWVEIAKCVRRSKGSLQTHFREELKLGRLQANFKVVANLYKMATGPTNEKTTVRPRSGGRIEGYDALACHEARREHLQGRRSDPDQATARNCCRASGQPARRRAGLQLPVTDWTLLQDDRHSNADEDDPEPDEKE
jgi:hypothetical protein